MGRRFAREEILERLRRAEKDGKPIIGAGCSAGIIAKCAEIGGADLIIVYSTGLSRIKGLPTTFIDDSNNVTLSMLKEIQNVVQDTPIIAGLEAAEVVAKEDLAKLVTKFIDAGFSGVINFPTISPFINESDIRREVQGLGLEFIKNIERRIRIAKDKEAKGLGFSLEVEMIRICRDMNIFTMAYVFNPKEARAMAEARVDCLVPHAGGTAGGLVGFSPSSYNEAAVKIQEMIETAKELNPDIICLGHGGPFATPEDTRYLYEHTDATGFVGASSIERIPVERAIKGVLEEFKNIPLK